VIRECHETDFEALYTVINSGAQAYRGVIPEDRWREPYMSREALRRELDAGVRFSGYEQENRLLGVMGIQDVLDVTLIRHAYVVWEKQGQGIGTRLLSHLMAKTVGPVLVGTWADAAWAVRFYEKRGFERVSSQEKDRSLRKYWTIPERQAETSVVLRRDRGGPVRAF